MVYKQASTSLWVIFLNVIMVCVCVCLSPRALITNLSVSFMLRHFCQYIAWASPYNETHHQCMIKKTKLMHNSHRISSFSYLVVTTGRIVLFIKVSS